MTYCAFVQVQVLVTDLLFVSVGRGLRSHDSLLVYCYFVATTLICISYVVKIIILKYVLSSSFSCLGSESFKMHGTKNEYMCATATVFMYCTMSRIYKRPS